MSTNPPIMIDIGQGLSLMIGLPTIASWETRKRPKNPKKGTFGLNTQTNSLEYWDGAGWLVTPMSEE